MTEVGCNIYGLFDPVTGICRYVGKTVQEIKKRMDDHLHDPSRNHRTNWFRGLAKKGLRPVAKLLAVVPETDAADEEIALIASLRATGAELLNATDGGDGVTGHRHSEETRSKMRESHLGKTLPAAQRQKIGESNLGRTFSEETKEKMRASVRATSLAALDAHRSDPKSDEAKANMSLAAKCRHRTNETGFRGVQKNKKSYQAKITVSRGVLKNLGTFKTAREAALVWDAAVVERDGDLAVTNASLGLL